jgi:hypothetical protein
VRAIGIDVHRDFCEVAIAQDGGVRSAGRVLTTPAALEVFARSLAPSDVVAMEATANALAIARIVEPHVARVVLANPKAVKGAAGLRAKPTRSTRACWRGCWPSGSWPRCGRPMSRRAFVAG